MSIALFLFCEFFAAAKPSDQSQDFLSRFRYEGMRVFCCDNCQNRIFEIDSLLVNHRHIKPSPLSLPLFMVQYSNLTINKLQKVKAIHLLFSYSITLVLILQESCILHQKQNDLLIQVHSITSLFLVVYFFKRP